MDNLTNRELCIKQRDINKAVYERFKEMEKERDAIVASLSKIEATLDSNQSNEIKLSLIKEVFA